MSHSIGKGKCAAGAIRKAIREAPLVAIREMLRDQQILDACEACGHRFRERQFGPVVTVLHFVGQALQPEESFAATWQEIFTPLAARLPELDLKGADLSGLTHARGRLPKEVMQHLARQACEGARSLHQPRWRGFRVKALDTCVVSMPDTPPLHTHYGTHRGRTGDARYPLGTFAALLDVGTSLIGDWRFGPYDPGELSTSLPLLEKLEAGDLLVADRRFSGASFLAEVRGRTADFLMRKHPSLKVQKLPVIRRLGKDDFLTELPLPSRGGGQAPDEPSRVRVRVFKAMWRAPTGAKVTEWFVTSLEDPRRFKKRKLARLYHARWRIETSYLEFKQTFGSAVLRSKTVANIEKELAAHVLAYQLTRQLIAMASAKHRKPPNQISVLNAARWVVHFSHRMSTASAYWLPILFQRLLDAIATCEIDVRPGRTEPRMLSRDPKRYPMRRVPRAEWRRQTIEEAA